MILVQPEGEEHILGVRQVEEQAFGRAGEADVVDRLRARGKATLSMVAVEDGQVVGHVLFSPVTLECGDARVDVLGMGPVAVLPGRQRQGIGSRLIRAALEEVRQAGYAAVVVLGDPRYYARFGFGPAARYGIRFQDPNVPAEDFMAQELRPGVLEEVRAQYGGGTARYEPEFLEV